MSEQVRDRRVLAISSLPAVGSAGLKNIIGVLGTRVVPVPSLLISGLGNMPGHKRFDLPFRAMLAEALFMAEQQGFELVLYTGYLHVPSQVDDILEMVQSHRSLIKAVVIDPVCGDHGKAYVPQSIINRFGSLLEIADVAMPNLTELALVQGLDVTDDLESLVDAFSVKYPSVELVTTGVILEDEIANYLSRPQSLEQIRHPMQVDRLLSGTGDLFAAFYIYFRYLKGSRSLEAVRLAGERIVSLIENDQDPMHRPEELQFDLNSAAP